MVAGEWAGYVSVSLVGIDHPMLHLGTWLVGQRMGVVNGGRRRCVVSDGVQRMPVTSTFVCFRWSADWLGKVDTEEVTGSNPVSPTSYLSSSDGLLPDLR
jgi:hypothetical protein